MARVGIDQGTINSIANSVANLANSADRVRVTANGAGQVARNLHNGVDGVLREFNEYREFDIAQKMLLNANTEINGVRAELEENFSAHATVRRHLTGILQASDLSMVKNDVIAECTEQLMMDCRGYWLAPCLIALAAWLGDNRELADRALAEAIKRDDERTSLLFALICRRFGRADASVLWLERYLAMQNPHEMERKMITVLDAYSNGMFGQQAKETCEQKIRSWITVMSAEEGFVEEQVEHWRESIFGKLVSRSYGEKYRTAKQYALNWAECERSLAETTLNQTILEYFQEIFSQETQTYQLTKQLDDLLENYVSSYDNEELPLRRKERKLVLIIEERGNVKRADERFESEQKALDEIFDFTTLLTSAAMHSDIINASNATQRLAIALSKDWIVDAYENILVDVRSRFPGGFYAKVEDWSGNIVDGDSTKHISKAKRKIDMDCALDVASVKTPKWQLVLCALCALIGIISVWSVPFLGVLSLLGAIVFIPLWIKGRNDADRQRADIARQYAQKSTRIASGIRGLCAEYVDYTRLLKEQDALSEFTLAYLRSIEAIQYVSHGEGREIRA